MTYGFGGVQNEIEEGLFELRGVAHHGREMGLQFANQLDALVGELVPNEET